MILICGATGRIGRQVVHNLIPEGHKVRALVRDREKATARLPGHTELVVGDMADPDVLVSALEGVTSLLLVSPVNPEQVTLQGNVVRAASKAGSPYIVKISGLGTAQDSNVDCGRWHAETEQQIVLSGLPYTFLRPLFFMQNLDFQLTTAKNEGVIRAGVGDARIAMIDVADIADVCAKLLVEVSPWMNETVTLTTNRSVSYPEVASLMSKHFGRQVIYSPQTLDAIKANLRTSGQPDWHINILLQFNQAFLQGLGDVANSRVADLLGRPARSLEDYLAQSFDQSPAVTDSDPFPS